MTPKTDFSEKYIPHSNSEIAGAYRCQKILKEWTSNIQTPSIQYIRLLHHTLFESSKDFGEKGLIASVPGTFRTSDLHISGDNAPQVASALDVPDLMHKYSKKLDEFLNEDKSNLDLWTKIRNASWSYYVFERIHPFLDGNGRTGRMILDRILKSYNFHDMLFHDTKWKKGNKSSHMEAIQAVDKTSDLNHLDLYIIDLIIRVNKQNKELINSLEELKTSKKDEINNRRHRYTIGKIWENLEEVGLN